jgi:cyclophilin family peptidyl-prolyl cis-trans isomerase
MNKQIMYLLVILAVIFLTIFLLAENESIVNKQPSNQPTQTQEQTAETTSSNNLKKPEMQISKDKAYQAILKTEMGEITISLNTKETPITANNFIYLAREGFYDNTVFHRVVKGFMIQGGDPLGNGTGGPGYQFADESFEGDYTRGTVAMANSGPNTNGSQFFIMQADNSSMPKDYVIFGKVTSGLEVVDKIALAEVTANSSGEASKPVEPVVVKSVEVIEEESGV